MIGDKLQEILDKKGMTQGELAEMINMSTGQINRIINNPNANPTIGTIKKIAEALDIPVIAFFQEDIRTSVLLDTIVKSLPEDIVKAMADRRNIEYILLGLELSKSKLPIDDIRIAVEAQEIISDMVKERRGRDK